MQGLGFWQHVKYGVEDVCHLHVSCGPSVRHGPSAGGLCARQLLHRLILSDLHCSKTIKVVVKRVLQRVYGLPVARLALFQLLDDDRGCFLENREETLRQRNVKCISEVGISRQNGIRLGVLCLVHSSSF